MERNSSWMRLGLPSQSCLHDWFAELQLCRRFEMPYELRKRRNMVHPEYGVIGYLNEH